MKRQLAYQVCYVIAAVAAFGGGAHAAGIATVTDVVNDGYRTPPGREEQIAKRTDELVQDEALRTDDDSSIQVQFVDGSQLSVESESELVLSDYVFDGAASQGMINLHDGLFHFTSNGRPDQGDGDDATVIDVLSGAVEARPNGTGKSVVCIGGQSILVAGADSDAQCGDLGSFYSASGASDRDRRPEPGHAGQDRERPEPPEKPDRPAPDPDPDTGDDGGGEGPSGEGSGSGLTMLFDEEPFDLG